MNIQPPRKKLFQGKQQQPDTSGLTGQVANLSDRLRLLEERHTNLDRKFEVMESNALEDERRMNREIKTLNSEVTEIKSMLDEFKDKINIMINELKTFAGKQEMDVLRKYIDLWDPVRFVTKKELEMALKSKE